MVVVDLDGDGLLDVLTPTLPSRGVRVYYGNGTVTLGQPASVLVADPPQYLKVVDANTDGRLDLATTSPEYSATYEPETTPHFVSVAYAGVVLTSGPEPRVTVRGTPTTSAGVCRTNVSGVALRCDVPTLRSGATVTVRFDLASTVIDNCQTTLYFRPSVYSATADRGVNNNAVEFIVRTPACTVTGRDRQPDGSLRGPRGLT